MADFLASHPMEDFFFHPTMTQDTSMETFARISIMSEAAAIDDYEIKRPVSIQDLFSQKFVSYHSEEESASPRDSSDSLSLDSEDGEIIELPIVEAVSIEMPESSIDQFLVPEQLAIGCTRIDDKCNRAQAVLLKPVGKPRMVSMPKLDTKRSSNESYRSVRRADSSKSITSSSRTIDLPTPAETISLDIPTPIEESIVSADPALKTPSEHDLSIPRASAAFDPFPKLADIAAGNMKRSITVTGVPGTSMSPAKRRLHRIASTLSNASDLVRRKSSVSSLRKTLVFDKDAPQTPAGPIPRRRSSVGKLTPRGPTERAPILVLPPFPDDEDEEEDDNFGDVGSDRNLPRWDRPKARHAKTHPSIDGIVAGV